MKRGGCRRGRGVAGREELEADAQLVLRKPAHVAEAGGEGELMIVADVNDDVEPGILGERDQRRLGFADDACAVAAEVPDARGGFVFDLTGGAEYLNSGRNLSALGHQSARLLALLDDGDLPWPGSEQQILAKCAAALLQ